MTNPIVRIPKNLKAAIDKVADDRGVRASVLIGQAIRFYLSATDPNLVASAVQEVLKPLAADLRHIKYVVDKLAATPASASPDRVASRAETEAKRRELFRELQEQKVRTAMERINQKSNPTTTTEEGTNS